MLRTDEIALDCSVQEAQEHYDSRLLHDLAVSSYVPSTYQRRYQYTYCRLSSLEDELSNHGDYDIASADVNDDIQAIIGRRKTLITAEHATNHMRAKADNPSEIYKKKRDFGTGAIALAATYDTDSYGLIARGRQTGDANRDINHPLKKEMTRLIEGSDLRAHIAIHGMGRGLAARIRDERGYSIQIGIGPKPSDATRTWVHDYLVPAGEEMGLVLGVNDPHIRFPNKKPMLSSNGKKLVRRIYGGSGQISGVGETTRDHAQKVAEQLGVNDEFAAAQLELNSVFRWHPDTPFLTRRDKELGAHIGYLFVKLAAQSANRL